MSVKCYACGFQFAGDDGEMTSFFDGRDWQKEWICYGCIETDRDRREAQRRGIDLGVLMYGDRPH